MTNFIVQFPLKTEKRISEHIKKYLTELNNTLKGALELIDRQSAEIERLQKHNETVLANCQTFNKNVEEATNKRFLEAINVVKSKAIKEFAERLKNNIDNGELYNYSEDYSLTIYHINNLVKEMTD